MGQKTEIPWTHATFNPWWGCAKVSPACDGCYAERWARRFGVRWGHGQARRYFGEKHWDEPRRWNAKCARQGTTKRVFCASMADVFDTGVEQSHRERLWTLIQETPSLTWLLLTKRIGNVAKMLPRDWGNGYPNVWLGSTVVNQQEIDRDIPKLGATPARIRFLSMEPLLEAVEIQSGGIDWVIVGGESGHSARSMSIDWVRSLRDQCQAAGIRFFVKQLSEIDTKDFRHFERFPSDIQIREFPRQEISLAHPPR